MDTGQRLWYCKVMKILILGGTRFIGKRIAEMSKAAGHEVILFNRGSNGDSQFATIRGEINRLLSFKSELTDLAPDIVVHCIAYTEQHARDCVEVFKGTGTHCVVLGSQDCYEAFQQANRGREISEFPISEDAPTSSIPYYWRGILKHPGGEDYDKNLMGQIFMHSVNEGQLATTIFRLPQVYGPDDYQFAFRHGPILRRIYDKRARLVLPQLDQNQVCTYGYVDNIAAAVVHSFGKEKLFGKFYNLGETQVRSRRRWADLYAQAAGWNFDYEILPDELLASDNQIRNQPPQHLIFDCSRYLIESGFQEQVKFSEGLENTLRWGLENSDSLCPVPDYKKEDRLIDAYSRAVDALIKEATPLWKTPHLN